jgi:3-oxoacyl-[acyl-carrier-protein] synthase-3
MIKSTIKGVGFYVPDNVVTNDDLAKLMTTNDEWITERTGIKERRHRKNRNDSQETAAYLGFKASEKAIKNAGLTAKDIDYIVLQPFLRIIIFRDVEFCFRICLGVIPLEHWM